jgi:hypothetical protein
VFPLERLLLSHWAVHALRLAFVLYVFVALWAAGRAVGRLFRLSVADEIAGCLVEIGLGFGAFSLVVRLLGAVGLARRELLLGLLLVPAALVLRMKRTGSLPSFAAPGLGRTWAAGVVALLPLPMALAPAVSYDSLVYQLRFPEMTLWTGRWAFDPANSPSYFPAATETLYLFGLSVDSSGVCAQLIHYGFFLLTLASLAVLGRSLAGSRAMTIAPLLFASIPAAGIVAGWSWSDMSLCFALLASALALAHEQVGPSVALLGLAAAIKYSGLALALPLAAAAAVVAVRRRRAPAFLAGTAAALLIAAPWYLFNWFRLRNPVYPLAPSLFGGSSETAREIVRWTKSQTSPWAAYILRPQTLDSDVGGIGLAVALVAALAVCVRNRLRLGTAAVVLGGFAVIAAFAPASRILLPPLAGGCLLAGIAAERWEGPRGARWAFTLSGLLALRGAALIAAHNALFFNPVPCAAGIEKPQEYRRRNFPAAALYERAEERLPTNARVLVFGESRLFGFPRPTIASTNVDPAAVARFLRGTAGTEEFFVRLRTEGVTHLLVSGDAFRPGPEKAVWRRGLSDSELAMLAQAVRLCRVVDRQDSLVLAELPAARGERPSG